jgi:PIN domain nuclease of toxin-antitoxin system
MNYLLDTHAALWWWADAPQLGKTAREAMGNPDNRIHFSAASAYEIHQKVRIGRLAIPDPLRSNLPQAVVAEGWLACPLNLEDACAAATLEHEHSDPFDRMLAAQAKRNGFTLITRDPFFSTLALNVIW